MGVNIEHEFKKACPFKFTIPENGVDCIKSKCALWLPIQRACSIQVMARGFNIKGYGEK